MSKTIDRRVVEMRFDNAQFERNAKTTMSTLDKLKAKLNFSGASKGLDNINSSADKVNMKGLSGALDTVHGKFSALEIMGVTALVNITNSAVNAGKRIVSALTIDPVRTGFREYETQLNSAQTIMANVGHKGKTLEDVNAALEELNKYADQTIYNFTEMTRNIGLFTNAGVGLEESVAAIKGFSNAAAMAGTDSVRAAGAMYQLSQAMSSGVVKLQDWRSLEQANITGERFQETIKITARAWGIAIDDMIDAEGSLRDTLKEGWLTADLMAEALNHYTLSRETMTEAEQEAAEAQMLSMGYTEEQIDQLFELGTEATNAATKVKSFTQLWEVLKESAQSGWSKTWQLIFGDLEQAKAIFTPLANFLTGIIDAISDARNNLLEGAFTYNPFGNLLDKLENSPVGAVAKKIDTISQSLEYYQTMVDKVWRGDYLNQPYRFGLLEAEGHNYKVIQELVNYGYQYKITTEEVAAAEKKFGVAASITEESLDDLNKTMESLTDQQLKDLELTDEEIKLYRELEQQSKKTGKSMSELISEMDTRTGRDLLIESFQNVGTSIKKIFQAIGEAWKDTLSISPIALYNFIKGLNELSQKFVMSDKTAENLKRTLRGVFAIIDMITMVIGGGFKIAFTIFKTILSAFNIDILQFTAYIGDAIYAVRNWLVDNNLLVKALKIIVPYIKAAAVAVKEWIVHNEHIANAISNLKEKLSEFKVGISDWLDGLKEADNVPKYIAQGLIKGLKKGFSLVIATVVELAKGIIEGVKKVLKIKSPSREFIEIGKDTMLGFVEGVKATTSAVFDGLKSFALGVIDFVKGFDFGKIVAIAVAAGMMVVMYKLLDVVRVFGNVAESITAPLRGFGELLESLGNGFENLSKAVKYKAIGSMIKNVALSVLMLAGSLYIISKINPDDLLRSALVLGGLVVVATALIFALSKLEKAGDVGKASMIFITIGASLFVLSGAIKKLSKIDPERMGSIIAGLIVMVGSIAGLLYAFGSLKPSRARSMDKAAQLIGKMGTTLLLMAIALKIMSGLELWGAIKAIGVLTSMFILIIALIKVVELAGPDADKAGKMMQRIAFALLTMITVIKLAAKLKLSAIIKGMSVVALIGVFFKSLIKVSIYSGKYAGKAGAMLLGAAVAIGILALVMKQIGNLRGDKIKKSLGVLAVLSLFLAGLIWISKFAGEYAMRAGVMLLLISGALVILSGVLFLLSKMDGKGLAKATAVIAVIEFLMMGLMQASQFIPGEKHVKSFIMMTVMLGILTASIIALSFIDTEKLLAASSSMAMALGSLAAVFHGLGAIKMYPKRLMKTILPMIGVVAALAAVFVILDKLDVGTSLETAGAISMALLAIAGSLRILGTIGKGYTNSITALALMGLVVGELALILGVLERMDIVPSIETAKSMSLLLLAMSASLVALGVVGLMGPAAFIGIGALATLIAAIGVLVVSIGALVDKFPKLETFIKKGIPILEKIGYALGAFYGNIVGGFSAGMSNGLPAIGENLTAFMDNIGGFLKGAEGIKKESIDGVTNLASAVKELVKADFINDFSSLLPGDMTLSELGTELSNFMKNAGYFVTNAAGIDSDVTLGVKRLAETVKILTEAELIDNISLGSTNDTFSKFGTAISELGSNFKTFVKDLGKFDPDQIQSVKTATEAIKSIAKVAADIPNDGGLLGKLVGNNTLASFGEALPELAGNIKDFVKGLDEVDEATGKKVAFDNTSLDKVKIAAKALKELVKVAADIPNDGGLWDKLVGNNTLASFGNMLPSLATNLQGFMTGLDGITKATSDFEGEEGATINETSLEKVKMATEILKAVTSAAAELSESGVIGGFLPNNNDLQEFARALPRLATGISGFAKNLEGLGEEQVTASKNASKVIEAMGALSGIKRLSSGNLSTFGGDVVTFSAKVKTFIKNISEYDSETINTVLNAVKSIIKISDSVSKDDAESLKDFGNALKSLAKSGIESLNKTLSNPKLVSNVTEGVHKLFDAVITGAEDKKQPVVDQFNNVIATAVAELTTFESLALVESAGKDFVEGFAIGISNNKYLATNAASELGRYALDAAKRAIDSNSPSKETMKIGGYFGEGFVLGIGDYAGDSYDAGYSIADTARNGLNKAIKKISSLVSGGIDAEPTIRPVLDLSNVESGAGYLSDMFNNRYSLGVSTNLNAINLGMASKRQNGTNGDVVYAIDRLRKDIDKVGGVTNNYNVNGVSYDGTSDISNAVETIIRAAMMDRRV